MASTDLAAKARLDRKLACLTLRRRRAYRAGLNGDSEVPASVHQIGTVKVEAVRTVANIALRTCPTPNPQVPSP